MTSQMVKMSFYHKTNLKAHVITLAIEGPVFNKSYMQVTNFCHYSGTDVSAWKSNDVDKKCSTFETGIFFFFWKYWIQILENDVPTKSANL